MQFHKIDHIMLLGGSRIMAGLASFLKKSGTFQFSLYTAPRQIDDVIYPDGTTLGEYLKHENIPIAIVEDINTDKQFLNSITPTTLGLGLGEAWTFTKACIDRFDGKLLDLMGIRLPQYRGGAHYTWQILRGNRIGACNLQVINEDMVQGEFDSGSIVYFKEYFFPVSARIPNHYFEEAVEQETEFVVDFLKKVDNGYTFQPFRLQENFSMLFPRLHTLKNAFIDWEWKVEELDRFVCAFDDPYAGCSTFLNGERVHLKKSRVEFNDGNFHPFQRGLVYKNYNGALFVCANNGTLVLESVLNADGQSILDFIKPGSRLYTPKNLLEEAHFQSISY